jgi:hypothetical protein
MLESRQLDNHAPVPHMEMVSSIPFVFSLMISFLDWSYEKDVQTELNTLALTAEMTSQMNQLASESKPTPADLRLGCGLRRRIRSLLSTSSSTVLLALMTAMRCELNTLALTAEMTSQMNQLASESKPTQTLYLSYSLLVLSVRPFRRTMVESASGVILKAPFHVGKQTTGTYHFHMRDRGVIVQLSAFQHEMVLSGLPRKLIQI